MSKTKTDTKPEEAKREYFVPSLGESVEATSAEQAGEIAGKKLTSEAGDE